MNVNTNWAAQLAQFQSKPQLRDTGGEPLALEEGDTFTAEVLGAKPDGTVSLRMPNGQRFLAELMTERPLVPGQRMTLTVSSVREGMPMVEVAGEGASSTETFLKAMNAPQNDLTTALAREILRQHTPFTPKQFAALSRAVAASPGLEPEQAVFMARHRIPITKENVAQYRALNEPQAQLGALLQKLLDLLPDTPAQRPVAGGLENPAPVAGGRDNPAPTTNQPAGQLPNSLLPVPEPAANQPAPNAPVAQGQETPAPVADGREPPPTNQQQPAAPNTPVTGGRENPAPTVQQPTQTAPVTVGRENPAPTVNQPTQTAPVAGGRDNPAPAANQPAQTAPVAVGRDNPAPVAGGRENPAPATNQPAQTTPVAGGRENPAPTVNQSAAQTAPVIGGWENPAPAANQPAPNATVAQGPETPAPVAVGRENPTPTANQPAAPNAPVIGGRDNPTPTVNQPAPNTPVTVGRENPAPTVNQPAAPNTSVAGGRENPAPTVQQPAAQTAPVTQGQENPAPVAGGRENPAPTNQQQPATQTALGETDIPRLLDAIFTKVERGRTLPREMDVPRQTREIGRMLTRVLDAAREMPEGARTEIMKAARDVVENLRFSDQLNHCASFAQMPLTLNGERTTAQLYVFNDSKEKKRIDPHNATVFVSLATANLGTVEGFVKVIGTGVDADFSLQTESAARLFRAGLPELGAMLEAQGYRLERVNASAEKPAPSTPAKVEKDRAVRAERYRFNRTV
ncbi:MAG: flagellar hook-length control protein FliK [Oscillospiraceae bacterium]|jgi:hypothetical protein|nr:flagellar hook-length control protein FliK [Oscillospiraceae bacterium]